MTGLSATDWSHLPDDVFIHVIYFSRDSSRGYIRAVCAQWKRCVDMSLSSARPNNILGFAKTLPKFPNLVSLDLTNCQQDVNDHVMVAISTKLRRFCPQLSEVSLKNCHQLTSHGVESLAINLPSLTALNLSGCRHPFPVSSAWGWGYSGVDGRGLDRLTHLLNLDLSWSTVCNDSLRLLHPLQQLQVLKLNHCHITDDGVALLTALTTLTELGLAHSIVLQRGPTILACLPNLRALDLRGCKQIRAPQLLGLSGCSALQQLCLAECGGWEQLPVEGLRPVASLPALQELQLSGCKDLLPAHLEMFRQHKTLTSLHLQNCFWVDDSVIDLVASIPQLSTLNICNCAKITRAGIALLVGATKLATLNISMCLDVGDYEVDLLRTLTMLTSLDVSYCGKVTRHGLAGLACGGSIRELCLCNIHSIDNEALAALLPLRHCLQQLRLSGCNSISSAGLKVLALGLPELTLLDISWCWAVDSEGVRALSSLPHLSALTFHGCCQVSKEALERLGHVDCSPPLLRGVRVRWDCSTAYVQAG